jgi:hypothetical protein
VPVVHAVIARDRRSFGADELVVNSAQSWVCWSVLAHIANEIIVRRNGF